jgi:hypothetical protein
MSANSLLGANGVIQNKFLPVGPSNNYVDNPMKETLQGGGFGMTNVGTIACNNISLPIIPTILVTSPNPQNSDNSPDGALISDFFPILTVNNYYTLTLTFQKQDNATGNVTLYTIVGIAGTPVPIWSVPAATFNAGNYWTVTITFKALNETYSLSLKDDGATGTASINVFNNFVYQAF